jgi:hypothetical protein
MSVYSFELEDMDGRKRNDASSQSFESYVVMVPSLEECRGLGVKILGLVCRTVLES